MSTLRPLTNKPNKSTDFFVFDSETGIEDEHGNIEYKLSARPESYIFGVIYGKDFCKVLPTVEAARKEFLKTRYKNKIIYAHNAEYDFTCVYGDIYKLDDEAIFNGKFICATNGNCTFADSYNLLQTSVQVLGEMLGIPKGKLGSNLKSHRNIIAADIQYCIRDCKIVYDALTEIFAGYEPKLTIGSLALNIFRRDFQTEPIKVNPLSHEFFKAYYGGRTEAFYIGKCAAQVYDINSAYPYAMRTIKFPNPLTLREARPHEYDEVIKNKNLEGMITAKVRYNNTHIPALPVRDEEKLIFPVGEIIGAWCLNEFRYVCAVHDIEILEIGKIIYSEAIETPFREFVDYYYNERAKTSNAFKKYYFKLFLNNLYGKLVQRVAYSHKYVEHEKDIPRVMKKLKITSCEIEETQRGFFLKYKRQKVSFTRHTVACWGAYITAEVRITLHKFMNIAPEKILYSDTDSVFVKKEFAPPKKYLGAELGKWKLEEKIITRIYAPKDYEYKDFDQTEKRKIKGVKKSAKQIAYNEFEFTRMIKTKESYRRKDKTPPGTFVTATKELKRDYTKRNVDENGETAPLWKQPKY